MNRGIKIEIFLKNGVADGIIKCSVANWVGEVYKIPRKFLNDCKGKEDYEKCGIYFLFGKDKYQKDAVYIGQANKRKNEQGLVGRIREPHEKEEWKWEECILFTTQKDTYGGTEISYLEYTSVKNAEEIGRYKVIKRKNPSKGNVTDATENELEGYFDYIKLVLSVLGYKVFEPKIQKNDNETGLSNNNPFYYIEGKNYKAKGKQVNNGFVVLAGSTISLNIVDSCPESAIKNRKKFANKLRGNKIITDILFSSPSSAADFVCGNSTNGLDRWRTSDGKKLKDMLK